LTRGQREKGDDLPLRQKKETERVLKSKKKPPNSGKSRKGGGKDTKNGCSRRVRRGKIDQKKNTTVGEKKIFQCLRANDIHAKKNNGEICVKKSKQGDSTENPSTKR